MANHDLYELKKQFDLDCGKDFDLLIRLCYQDVLDILGGPFQFSSTRTYPSVMYDIFKTRINQEIGQGKFEQIQFLSFRDKFYLVYDNILLIDFTMAQNGLKINATSKIAIKFAHQQLLLELDLPKYAHAYLCYVVKNDRQGISSTALVIPKGVRSVFTYQILNEGASEFEFESAVPLIKPQTNIDKLLNLSRTQKVNKIGM